MSQPDFRQDKQYRRGLILGLTIAEVMILLIFVLLMALAAALADRDGKLKILGDGKAAEMVEAIQQAYPKARSGDDVYKELVRAIDTRKAVEQSGLAGAKKQLEDYSDVGRAAVDAARASGEPNPRKFAESAIAKARAGKKGEWPPFFSLSEAGGYYFDSGRATLRPAFELNLKTVIVPLLRKNIDDYGVDVVEVIGHTDEVPMAGDSNLDRHLIAASASRFPIAGLQSTDNAGLAIARAVAVVHVLRADPRLRGVTILPLSGAQMIAPGDRLADGADRGDDQSRRRIEIRLRRASEQAVPRAVARESQP